LYTLVARALSLSVAAVLIGAAVGVGLVAAWATVGTPTQCVPSERIAILPTLTPILIVNSPYGGFANGSMTTYDNTSTSVGWDRLSVGARNGSVTYVLEVANWTIWTTKRVGDPAGSCAGVFSYSENATKFTVDDGTPRSYTNDSQAPQYSGGNSSLNTSFGQIFNGQYADLLFNDSFSSSHASSMNVCEGGMGGTVATSTYLSFRIPFEFRGSEHVLSVTINELTNYTYTFGAKGVFEVDELSSFDGPGGGDSFMYTPCPD
jgi:hypothetical protein